MPQLYEIDDKELLIRISKSDRIAFTFLYNRYGNNLLRFVSSICFSKETAEEIVQDLFLKIWLQREEIVDVGSIKPYLYRATKNILLNHIRTTQKETRVIDGLSNQPAHSVNNPEDELVYNECYHLAQTAIDLLPDKRKLIFKMRHDDNLSLDEISAKLSISKSVVKKQLYSGIHFVRAYLSKHGDVISFLFGVGLYLKK